MMKKTMLALAVLLPVSGCAPLQMIGALSHQEDFRCRDTMTLPEARADLVAVIQETGKSLGLRVSAIDREAGMITLTSTSSVAEEIAISKVNRADYAFRVLEGGRKVEIQIVAWGNLGSGAQETADKMLGDMKAAIEKRLESPSGSR